MAATTGSSGGGAAGPAATPPVDERDYTNPGIFVMPWPGLFVIEDPALARRATQELKHIRTPFDLLATLKVHAPELSKDIVICGWAGVDAIIQRLHDAVIRRAREGVRRA
jgi:hypothetical protein